MRIDPKYFEIKQGSQEWLDLRGGCFSASEVAKLYRGEKDFTEGGITYIEDTASESLLGLDPPVSFKNGDWGHENEPKAEATYGKSFGVELIQHAGQPILFDDVLKPHTWASPDRLVPALDRGLEIKCPATKAWHGRFCAMQSGWDLKDVKLEYYAQVQMCMLVFECDKWDFMSFHPNVPAFARAAVFTIERDEVFLRKLTERLYTAVILKSDFVQRIKNNLL